MEIDCTHVEVLPNEGLDNPAKYHARFVLEAGWIEGWMVNSDKQKKKLKETPPSDAKVWVFSRTKNDVITYRSPIDEEKGTISVIEAEQSTSVSQTISNKTPTFRAPKTPSSALVEDTETKRQKSANNQKSKEEKRRKEEEARERKAEEEEELRQHEVVRQAEKDRKQEEKTRKQVEQGKTKQDKERHQLQERQEREAREGERREKREAAERVDAEFKKCVDAEVKKRLAEELKKISESL